ncbi:hypothetical protein GCM10012285_26140 [Streptomyces kronopolitis]|uniref:Uncharacterized protein n=1 Tax=Streptomyces kronopolitis TaxID=1612435 RepID=A0ABQ2JD26_9ACTN|nr:hypothetical protein GCM10012285_26140 [Streptomyces kronopolitis]
MAACWLTWIRPLRVMPMAEGPASHILRCLNPAPRTVQSTRSGEVQGAHLLDSLRLAEIFADAVAQRHDVRFTQAESPPSGNCERDASPPDPTLWTFRIPAPS